MVEQEHANHSLNGLRDFLSNQSLLDFTGPSDIAIDAISTVCDILLGEKAWSWAEVAGLTTYTSTVNSVTLTITLVGSYGLGMWDPSEPIRLCIAGTPSEKTFFSLARTKFRKAEAHLTLLKSDRKTRRSFELGINGHKVLLHYRQAPLTANPGKGAKSTFSSKGSSTAQIDAEYLCQRISDLEHREIFQKTYQLIKLWALHRGIYSPRFGYLDEDHLLQLVADVCQENHAPAEVTAQFFSRYSTASQNQEKKAHPATHRTPPTLAAFESRNTLDIIRYYIRDTQKQLQTEEWSWMAIVEGPQCDKIGVIGFLSSYEAYIHINAWYAGASGGGAVRFADWLDVTVARHAKGFTLANKSLKPRAWPSRFKDLDKERSESTYTAHYLIGLRQSSTASSSQLEGRVITMGDTVRHEGERYATTSFVEAHLVKKQELESAVTSLVPNVEQWTLLADELDPEETSDEDSDSEAPSGPTFQTKQMKRDTAVKAKLAPVQVVDNMQTTPLRPAMDIYNRIIHDASFSPDNFMIGYTDRFKGTLEMPLTWWAPEDKSSEKFIPQSRIRYFKKKDTGDGLYVWHRETKLDLIFGSGHSVDSYAWKHHFKGVARSEVPPAVRAW